MEKVTKTYQILTGNDIDTTLDEIQKKTLKVIMKKYLQILKRNF